MALPVGDIVELVGPDRAVLLALRQLLGEPAGELHVIVRIGIRDRRHLDQLGAAEPQRVFLLLALRFRNDDHRAKAERVADQRKPDAGIARGTLDDHAARLERAPLHRVLNDEQRGAVLHRLARIYELGLAENRAAGRRRNPLKLDEWCIADRLDDSVAKLHRRVILKKEWTLND